MKISIFGLGYVGAVTAGCLARRGHFITGVDVHPQKVESFNQGIALIVEPGLDELLRAAKAKESLRATLDCEEAIRATDVSIVCVGTPSTITGALDLSFVRSVIDQIGGALRKKQARHSLVLRSTMLPGSTKRFANELLDDLLSARRLDVYYYPEFLRESTAVFDFENPSLAVVGTGDGAKPQHEIVEGLFGNGIEIVDWPTAEMVKYACNAFHAAKIVFANEIGRIARPLGIDSRLVMDLLCRDTRLNLSPYYTKPGNPFGGSCLPKDVRALAHLARTHGLQTPMLESLLPSNERHLQALLSLVMDSAEREVTILGLSFKPDTDDLRESAMVELAQTLLGRGYKLRIYDPALDMGALIGVNKRVIDAKMPHLATLLCSKLEQAVGQRGLIVAAQKCARLEELKRFVTSEHSVLDVNGWPELKQLPSRYIGFCW
jgi:GDP-mannose 6-dehydrogenase